MGHDNGLERDRVNSISNKLVMMLHHDQQNGLALHLACYIFYTANSLYNVHHSIFN